MYVKDHRISVICKDPLAFPYLKIFSALSCRLLLHCSWTPFLVVILMGSCIHTL